MTVIQRVAGSCPAAGAVENQRDAGALDFQGPDRKARLGGYKSKRVIL